MDSSNPRDDRGNDDASRRQDDLLNPFIAFRRFADEQVSALIGLIGGIGEDLSRFEKQHQENMRRRAQQEPRHEKQEAESKDGVEETWTLIQRQMERQWVEWEKRVKRTQEENEQWLRERERTEVWEQPGAAEGEQRRTYVHDLYGQEGFTDSEAQRDRTLAALGFSFPRTNGVTTEFQRASSNAFNSLVTAPYLMFDSNSPLHLEASEVPAPKPNGANPANSGHPSRPWRNAFEDLLLASEGQPMRSESDHRANDALPAAQWLKKFSGGVYSVGAPVHPAERPVFDMFPKPWFFEHEAGRSSNHPQPEQLPDTEEELYRRFFGITLSDEEKVLAPSRHAGIHTSTEAHKPSVLSTLTKTERVMQPDGMITTKTVLKKRFADGTEEKSETIHTEPAVDSWRATGQPVDVRNTTEKEEEKPKKGGWFWSS